MLSLLIYPKAVSGILYDTIILLTYTQFIIHYSLHLHPHGTVVCVVYICFYWIPFFIDFSPTSYLSRWLFAILTSNFPPMAHDPQVLNNINDVHISCFISLILSTQLGVSMCMCVCVWQVTVEFKISPSYSLLCWPQKLWFTECQLYCHNCLY